MKAERGKRGENNTAFTNLLGGGPKPRATVVENLNKEGPAGKGAKDVLSS